MPDNAVRQPPPTDPATDPLPPINRPRVEIFSMPHNGRCALWPGEVDAEGEALVCPPLPLLSLPVAMPEAIFVSTDPNGRPLAVDLLGELGGRIRREDTDWSLRNVYSFNAALGD